MFKKQTQTKCWTCRNAVPNEVNGCSWSVYGEPVDGWIAKPNELISNGEFKDTYLVVSCPEYVRDKKRKVSVNEDSKYNWKAVIV